MKNERYSFREWAPTDATKPSAPLSVYWITEDIARVTHSASGKSVQLCLITQVTWDDDGLRMTRWLILFFLQDTRCSILWHVVTRVPEEPLPHPASYTSWFPLASVWASRFFLLCLSLVWLFWTGRTVGRHVHKPLPAPRSLFLHTSKPSFCYGRGCTLAFIKQPEHVTLPDTTSMASQETNGLSWEQTGVQCLTNTPSHQQNKEEDWFARVGR